MVFILFLPFDLIKAGATQTETSSLKKHKHDAGERVCVLDDVMFSFWKKWKRTVKIDYGMDMRSASCVFLHQTGFLSQCWLLKVETLNPYKDWRDVRPANSLPGRLRIALPSKLLCKETQEAEQWCWKFKVRLDHQFISNFTNFENCESSNFDRPVEFKFQSRTKHWFDDLAVCMPSVQDTRCIMYHL